LGTFEPVEPDVQRRVVIPNGAGADHNRIHGRRWGDVRLCFFYYFG
jgi:hypothetical protein